jgi:outer membrane protein
MTSTVRPVRLARLVAAGALCAASALAVAQDAPPKIGYVSLERIIRESTAAKSAQERIQQEFSRRDKDLQDLAARLKQMSEKLERDAPVTAEGERLRRQRELADLDREFQRKQREFREDINQRRNEELATVIDRANRVIRQIAEQERYDMIIQDAVHVSPRIDMTEKVLRQLNAAK